MMNPAVFLLAVYLIGFPINWLGSQVKSPSKKYSMPTVLGAVGFAILSVLGNISIGNALEGLVPSLTVVMIRTQVIIVMFLGWLILKEQLNPLLIPGAMIALFGLLWMNYQGNDFFSGEWRFYLWGISAAFLFGTSQLLIKRIIHQIDPIQLNHIRLLLGGIFLALVPGTLSALFQLSVEGWILAGTSALFGPSLSRILQMYALRYLPVSQSILFTLLTPVFALLLSVIFLDIYPSTQQLIGVSSIMFGISMPIVHLVRLEQQQNYH